MYLRAVGVLLLVMGAVKCTKGVDGNDVINLSKSTKNYSTFIDLMIAEISNQEWKENELQCHSQILNILRNVQNSTLWATWIWNSMQLPTGQFFGARVHIGNFDQCLRRLWRDDPVPTQYCLTDVQLTTTDGNRDLSNVNAYDTAESYLKIQTEYEFMFNVMSWGVCVPAVCTKQSVKRFVSTMFKLSHMGTINDQPLIEVQDCQRTHIPRASTTGLYLLILIAVLFIIVACVCTCISDQESSKHYTILMKITKGFNLRNNASNLLAVNENDIKVMHGLRSLSSCTVIGLHAIFSQLLSSPANGLDQNRDFELYANFLSHVDILVDTFFMMSGLLLMKSFRPRTERVISPLKVIVKRYFRFIWVFAIMIVVMVTGTPYLIGGPLWMKYGKGEQESCEKSWWLALLMLNNYVEKKNICMQISWYIPADFHMTVVTIILYWFHQKNQRGGVYLFGLVATASVLLPGIYTYVNELEALIPFRFRALGNTRESLLDDPAYVYSHLRASSYFVGLAAGYILSIYKPTNYRNVISKAQTILCLVIIIVLCTSILLLGPVFLFREYSAFESALFVTINRPLWAVLCAALIMISEYGSLPIISKFLGWTVFVVLSKLSYGMYLCHYIFLLRLVVPLRSQSWHDPLKIFQDSIGVIVMSVLVSLFIALFIEFPLNNIMELVINIRATPQNEANDTSRKSVTNINSVCTKNKLEVCLNGTNDCTNTTRDHFETLGVGESMSNVYLSEDTKKDI